MTSTTIALKCCPSQQSTPASCISRVPLTEIALAESSFRYFAIATLVRRRSAALAHRGRDTGSGGRLLRHRRQCAWRHQPRTASTAHMAKLQAARFLTTSFNSGAGKAFFDIYAFSELLAPVLMAVALWRSRLVPRWLSVVFLVGFGLAEQTRRLELSVLLL